MFELHDIQQTSDTDITTRWTMTMDFTPARALGLGKWWQPHIIFTGKWQWWQPHIIFTGTPPPPPRSGSRLQPSCRQQPQRWVCSRLLRCASHPRCRMACRVAWCAGPGGYSSTTRLAAAG